MSLCTSSWKPGATMGSPLYCKAVDTKTSSFEISSVQNESARDFLFGPKDAKGVYAQGSFEIGQNTFYDDPMDIGISLVPGVVGKDSFDPNGTASVVSTGVRMSSTANRTISLTGADKPVPGKRNQFMRQNVELKFVP